MKKIFSSIGPLLILMLVSGCGAISHPGSPATSYDPDQDIKELSKVFGSATSISDYYKTPETRAKRDAFVTGRLTLINLQYIQFIRQFAVNTAQLDSAFDITKLGVDLATTLVGGATTKSILGAISAGLTGSRTSIEKNFFQQKTVPVLISEMNAQRKIALVPIVTGLSEGIDRYPLASALVDLQNYYEAGTFVGALQSIQKDAGAKEAAADTTLNVLRSTVFAADASSDRIKAFIWPSGIGQPVNQGNLDKLRGWMAANLPVGLPIATFLNAPTLANARKKAIADLSIP